MVFSTPFFLITTDEVRIGPWKGSRCAPSQRSPRPCGGGAPRQPYFQCGGRNIRNLPPPAPNPTTFVERKTRAIRLFFCRAALPYHRLPHGRDGHRFPGTAPLSIRNFRPFTFKCRHPCLLPAERLPKQQQNPNPSHPAEHAATHHQQRPEHWLSGKYNQGGRECAQPPEHSIAPKVRNEPGWPR